MIESPSDDTFIQQQFYWGWGKSSEEDEDHSNEFFHADQDGLQEGAYTRVLPAPYEDETSDNVDTFMKSMYENYALEQKTKDGKPSGKFWMDGSTAKAASMEVLETHKGLHGSELQAWINQYFPKTWAHFDVNLSGKIEVTKMPQFMRFIASDQSLSLDQ